MRGLCGWYSALYSLIQQQFKQLIQIDSESTDQQIWPKDVFNHILFFQVTLCASKIVLFYSSSQVYKNLVFAKLPHHSLCLILSKQIAQASLNLWMIHPNTTDETQRKAVKWTVFFEPMYVVYISCDISSKAFPMCLQDPSVSLRADFKIFHFNLLKVNANTIFWCVIITILDNISFHIKV